MYKQVYILIILKAQYLQGIVILLVACDVQYYVGSEDKRPILRLVCVGLEQYNVHFYITKFKYG